MLSLINKFEDIKAHETYLKEVLYNFFKLQISIIRNYLKLSGTIIFYDMFRDNENEYVYINENNNRIFLKIKSLENEEGIDFFDISIKIEDILNFDNEEELLKKYENNIIACFKKYKNS